MGLIKPKGLAFKAKVLLQLKTMLLHTFRIVLHVLS
jgi:hypothetical protein